MKKTEIKSSGRRASGNVNKKSLKSDNLKASETSPVLNSIDKNLKRTTVSSTSKRPVVTPGNSKWNTRKSSLPKIPKDAAVHFGNFYGLRETVSGKAGDSGQSNKNTGCFDMKSSPKSEFTRQMVQKLERSAGTEDYARQVSALLDDTVEPANFRVNPLPPENSIPDGRQNPTGYPLWYKHPYKMPLTAKKEYQQLKEKFRNMKVSTKVESQTYVEEATSSEDERDDANSNEYNEEIEEEEEDKEEERNTDESSKNLSSDRSSSADETIGESSISYESSYDDDDDNDEDDDDSYVSSDREEENDDYETVDNVLSVR